MKARQRSHRRGGFTLIEVMVAIGIMAVVSVGALSVISAIDGAKSRQAAGKVSAAVRESFDRAALSGSVHRLVFGLGEASMRLEVAQGFFTLPALSDSGPSSAQERAKARAEAEEELFEGLSDEAKAGLAALRTPPTWTPVDGPLGEGISLGEVKILGFWSDAFERFQKQGDGLLYFFPRGETQDAVFWLGANDDDIFTVRVDGMAARLHTDFGRLDHLGKTL
jgi:general secretion pathway protein H